MARLSWLNPKVDEHLAKALRLSLSAVLYGRQVRPDRNARALTHRGDVILDDVSPPVAQPVDPSEKRIEILSKLIDPPRLFRVFAGWSEAIHHRMAAVGNHGHAVATVQCEYPRTTLITEKHRPAASTANDLGSAAVA